MSAVGAWRDGVRRVNRAPAILVGVWALTLLVSVPLTLALRGDARAASRRAASPPTRRPAA